MNASPEPTVGLASARAVIEYFQHFHISTSQLAKLLDADESLFTDEEKRIPISLYQKIWALIQQKSQSNDIGLIIAQQESMADLGLVAHVVYNSHSLKEGLTDYIRLFSVVNESIELEVEDIDGSIHLRYIVKSADYYVTSDMERTLAIAVNRTIKSIGKHCNFKAVHFQHSKPEYAQTYAELFPCKVLFDQPHCAIIFDKRMLSVKLNRPNPHIRRATLNYANQILSRLFKRSISHKVKRLIEKNLMDGAFDAEMAAKHLNMSRQTLYRKLKNDGASYSELVDDVKKNKAVYLLKQQQLPLTVIAYDLGFSELSAFTRAFKRWTGETPAEYRKQFKQK